MLGEKSTEHAPLIGRRAGFLSEDFKTNVEMRGGRERGKRLLVGRVDPYLKRIA